MKKFASIAAIAVATVMVVGIGSDSATAGLLFNRAMQEPIPSPAEPASPSDLGPMLAPATPLVDPSTPIYSSICCPASRVSYRHAGLFKVKCCSCDPPIQSAVCVVDPCTCCPVAIPVCLPPCCTDCPKVSSRHGLLANGVVTYDWCCGVSVTVRFQKSGGILVTYRGV
ncbi:MAG TPA: hypothetical protein VG713_02005 [Pirellulales bacterium]|nr:hypothetical protein [Pirellulales bacterium]